MGGHRRSLLAVEERRVATPAENDFVISQGDSLPVMRVVIPPNSAGELIDLTGCTVTFLGRINGTRTYPSPIIRPIESYQSELATENDAADFDSLDVGDDIVAVYVHLTTDDTKAIAVPVGANYVKMDGELEIISGDDTLTVPNDIATVPYIKWWIRDDIGDGA